MARPSSPLLPQWAQLSSRRLILKPLHIFFLILAFNIILLWFLNSQATASQTRMKEACDERVQATVNRLEAEVENAVAAIPDLSERVDKGLQRLEGVQKQAALPTTTVPPLKWLTIGIPTVSRSLKGEGLDYLTVALDSLLKQIPSDPSDPSFDRIEIVVMNNNPPEIPHPAFQANQRRFEHTRPQLVFVENPRVATPAHTPTPLNSAFDRNKPSARVQKQTRDVGELLQFVSGRSSYFLLLEDDFESCPHALAAIQHVINKAHRRYSTWLAMRVSYGLNGLILHNQPPAPAFPSHKRGDVWQLSLYLLQHFERRPPDHLAVEWFAGETAQSGKYKSPDGNDRPHVTFRWNLFNHIGVKSSLQPFDQTHTASCFAPLYTPTLFPVEAYRFRDCDHDDLWPCASPEDSDDNVKWHIPADSPTFPPGFVHPE